MPRPTPARTFREFSAGEPFRWKIRTFCRNIAIQAASSFRTVPTNKNWIRFPYYHHVFDDECVPFASHLRYMKGLGEFVTLGEATKMLRSADPIRGRFFCLTFDDGFQNCASRAVPILLDHKIPAAFFLPTKHIGTSIQTDFDLFVRFFGKSRPLAEFLSWDDCRSMLRAGMSFGSHTENHARLRDLSEADVTNELLASKGKIERELGVPCVDFCPPWGRPWVDFSPAREPELARRAGYLSFMTAQRGSFTRVPSPVLLERDHLIAIWDVSQVRYFLSQ